MVDLRGHKTLWVAGGRDFDDRQAMKEALRQTLYLSNPDLLITGAARGADLLAESVWRASAQLPYVGIPAQWDQLGNRAGYVRNHNIARMQPDMLLAFPGGKGTKHAIDLAFEYEIEVVEW